jgi:hypothetical protein
LAAQSRAAAARERNSMKNNTKTKTFNDLGIDLPNGLYGRSEDWARQFAQEILPGLHEDY